VQAGVPQDRALNAATQLDNALKVARHARHRISLNHRLYQRYVSNYTVSFTSQQVWLATCCNHTHLYYLVQQAYLQNERPECSGTA
jgi:hypothetical protein